MDDHSVYRKVEDESETVESKVAVDDKHDGED